MQLENSNAKKRKLSTEKSDLAKKLKIKEENKIEYINSSKTLVPDATISPRTKPDLKTVAMEVLERNNWLPVEKLDPSMIKKKASEIHASPNLFRKILDRVYKEHSDAEQLDAMLDCGDWGAPTPSSAPQISIKTGSTLSENTNRPKENTALPEKNVEVNKETC